jgi:plasmid stabilization system protein ParE
MFYRVERDRVRISRVLHGRRDLPAALSRND